MRKSKWGMFKKLYIKEMQEIKQELLAIIVFALAINVASFIWPESPVVILPLMLVIMASGVVPIISSVRSLAKEWNNNTIYLLMSLPVKGIMVFSAKLLALFTEFLIGTSGVILITATNFMIKISVHDWTIWSQFSAQFNEISPHLSLLIKVFLGLYALILTLFIYLVSIVFLSQTIARIKGKYMKIVSYISFATLIYVGSKISNWVLSNLPWIQQLNYITLEQVSTNLTLTFLSTIAVLVILSALMLTGAGTIYDKKLEL